MSQRANTSRGLDGSSASKGSRLNAVLAAGFERALVLQSRSRDAPADVGARRGARLAYDDEKEWQKQRRDKLTASLLPYWVKLSKTNIPRVRIVRIITENDGLFKLPTPTNPQSAEILKEVLDWGKEHEEDALKCYLEITRNAVALGSTQVREPLLGGQDGLILNQNETFFSWARLLSATPDGVVFAADEKDVYGQPKTGRGLLEIKAPGDPMPVPSPSGIGTIPRRHDVEICIRLEFEYALLVQAWAQLEVVQEADFVDLIKWKKDYTFGKNYIYYGRLYRNSIYHGAIKTAMAPSFSSFQEALDVLYETDDEDNPDPELARKKREFEPKKQTTSTKNNLKAALNKWTDTSLKWRNCDPYDAAAGYPWRSKAELREVGRSPSFLANRYQLETGEVATHEDTDMYTPVPPYLKRIPQAQLKLRGYSVLAGVTVPMIFQSEHFVEPPTRIVPAPATPPPPPPPDPNALGAMTSEDAPYHIFKATDDRPFVYMGVRCIRCNMICRPFFGSNTQRWVDEGDTDSMAVCYGATVGVSEEEDARRRGVFPSALMSRDTDGGEKLDFDDEDELNV